LEYYRGVVIDKNTNKEDPRLKYVKKFNDKETKWEETAVMFDEVYEKYPRTKLGLLGLFYSGNCYYELGDYKTAGLKFESYIDKVNDDKKGNFVNLALEGLAFSNERAGDIEGALMAFERMIIPENKAFRERGLFNAARLYQAKENNSKALELYKTLVADFPMSRTTFMVQKIITKLEAGT